MVELVLRVVVSLGVVLGLFWTVARLGSRKMGGVRGGALVRVRSRQALSRGSSLAVVEVGSRVLVVGVSDSGVRLLTELDPCELEGEAAGVTGVTGGVGPTVRPAGQAGALSGRRGETRPRLATVRRAAGAHAAETAPLAGSILAPTTWRQAWAAATDRTGRSEVPAGETA